MILFEYKVSPARLSPVAPESIFRITVTSDKENNVIARMTKEKVLDLNGVSTMILTCLQHWPKHRKPSNDIKI